MTAGTTRALVAAHRRGPVAELVVGDGRKRNALTTRGWAAVEQYVREFSDDPDLQAIVIRGNGETFCAGSDIGEWLDSSPAFVEESFARMESAFRAVEQCPVPVVAEIQGVAAGAGCQLALACDLRFMADRARIGMPIARLGILASPAFAARLTTLAGPALAGELLYTGRLLDGPAAVRAGLATAHFPAAELRDQVQATLAAIRAQPPAAIRAAKRAVGAALAPVRAAVEHNPAPAVSWPHFTTAVRSFLG